MYTFNVLDVIRVEVIMAYGCPLVLRRLYRI